jgi:hypothetical protein
VVEDLISYQALAAGDDIVVLGTPELARREIRLGHRGNTTAVLVGTSSSVACDSIPAEACAGVPDQLADIVRKLAEESESGALAEAG